MRRAFAQEQFEWERHELGMEKSHRYLINSAENLTTHYSFLTYFVLFYVFSIAGWVWEFLVNAIIYHRIWNPGFFHGPWVPIYGFAGLSMLFLSQFARKNLTEVFLFNMLVSGGIEYLTSYIQEKIYGVVWWDYSHEFMNLNGRICLAVLLMFGLAGCFIIYFVTPLVNHWLQKQSSKQMKTTLIVLSGIFLLDVLISLIFPNACGGKRG